MLKKVNCIYGQVCAWLKDILCPCNLEGATKIVPQIKADLETAGEERELYVELFGTPGSDKTEALQGVSDAMSDKGDIKDVLDKHLCEGRR